jgi:hypothetical protein
VLVRWLGLDRRSVQVKGFPTSYRRGRSSFAANGSVVTQQQVLPGGLMEVEEPLYLTLNGGGGGGGRGMGRAQQGVGGEQATVYTYMPTCTPPSTCVQDQSSSCIL